MPIRTQSLPAAALLAFAACTASAAEPVGFLVFGDSGYVPAYELPDDDEPPAATLGQYMAAQAEEWLERNRTLDGFVAPPWTFETVVGGYVPQSGLYPVANAMRGWCRDHRCAFASMLGDNIYPDGATGGTDGIDDERRFRDLFAKPFGALGGGDAGFAIHAVLGNHDWHTSEAAALAQRLWLDRNPPFSMPDLRYRVVPPGLDGQVELFFIETTLMLAAEEVRDVDVAADGSAEDHGLDEEDPHVVAAAGRHRDPVRWLDQALRESAARWKLVFGHHPLWSGGGSKGEQARVLRRLLLPTLCRHADAYFAGHEHSLEAWTDPCAGVAGAPDMPLPTIVSGAAAKYRPSHPRFIERELRENPGVDAAFVRGSLWGFAHVELEDDAMRVVFISTPGDMSGQVVVEAERTFARRSGER